MHVLEDDPWDSVGFISWWFDATRFDPMSGTPGLPEWPYPGGPLKQPAKFIEAVHLLRSEWHYLRSRQDTPKKKRKGKKSER